MKGAERLPEPIPGGGGGVQGRFRRSWGVLRRLALGFCAAVVLFLAVVAFSELLELSAAALLGGAGTIGRRVAIWSLTSSLLWSAVFWLVANSKSRNGFVWALFGGALIGIPLWSLVMLVVLCCLRARTEAEAKRAREEWGEPLPLWVRLAVVGAFPFVRWWLFLAGGDVPDEIWSLPIGAR